MSVGVAMVDLRLQQEHPLVLLLPTNLDGLDCLLQGLQPVLQRTNGPQRILWTALNVSHSSLSLIHEERWMVA